MTELRVPHWDFRVGLRLTRPVPRARSSGPSRAAKIVRNSLAKRSVERYKSARKKLYPFVTIGGLEDP